MLQCWLQFAAAVPRCAARGTAARGAAASRQPAMQCIAMRCKGMDVSKTGITSMSDGFELIIFLHSDAQPSPVTRSIALSCRRRARNEVLSSVRLTLLIKSFSKSMFEEDKIQK